MNASQVLRGKEVKKAVDFQSAVRDLQTCRRYDDAFQQRAGHPQAAARDAQRLGEKRCAEFDAATRSPLTTSTQARVAILYGWHDRCFGSCEVAQVKRDAEISLHSTALGRRTATAARGMLADRLPVWRRLWRLLGSRVPTGTTRMYERLLGHHLRALALHTGHGAERNAAPGPDEARLGDRDRASHLSIGPESLPDSSGWILTGVGVERSVRCGRARHRR